MTVLLILEIYERKWSTDPNYFFDGITIACYSTSIYIDKKKRVKLKS